MKKLTTFMLLLFSLSVLVEHEKGTENSWVTASDCSIYVTEATGGSVDFEHFQISEEITKNK